MCLLSATLYTTVKRIFRALDERQELVCTALGSRARENQKVILTKQKNLGKRVLTVSLSPREQEVFDRQGAPVGSAATKVAIPTR